MPIDYKLQPVNKMHYELAQSAYIYMYFPILHKWRLTYIIIHVVECTDVCLNKTEESEANSVLRGEAAEWMSFRHA